MQERQEEQRDELRGQAYRSGGPELRPRSSAETLLGSCSQPSIVRARCSWTRGKGGTTHRGLAPPRPLVAAPCQASAPPSIRWGYRAPVHTAGRHGQLCMCLQGRAGCPQLAPTPRLSLQLAPEGAPGCPPVFLACRVPPACRARLPGELASPLPWWGALSPWSEELGGSGPLAR